MDAQEFVNSIRNTNRLVRLAHYSEDKCDGRGNAIVVDPENSIAVIVDMGGIPEMTQIIPGAVVQFSRHPEAEPRIIGSPAYVSPTVVGGRKFGKSS
jgi:hypothetical protein